MLVQYPTKTGFTLIELLVSVTIMLVLVGDGIANFIKFNERQLIIAHGKEVRSLIESARTRARNSDKPPACDALEGYSIEGEADDADLTLLANCSNGDVAIEVHTLPTRGSGSSMSVRFENDTELSFKGLHGGATGDLDIVLVTDPERYQYSFEVNAGGQISDGVFEVL